MNIGFVFSIKFYILEFLCYVVYLNPLSPLQLNISFRFNNFLCTILIILHTILEKNRAVITLFLQITKLSLHKAKKYILYRGTQIINVSTSTL